MSHERISGVFPDGYATGKRAASRPAFVVRMFRGCRGGRGLTEGRRGVAAERDWSLRAGHCPGRTSGWAWLGLGSGWGWARLGLGSLGELPAAVTRWLRLVN